jgi:hypothetical protein
MQFIDTEEEQVEQQVDYTNVTMSDKIQYIINKHVDISDQEKLFIFQYCKTSPD